MINWHRLFGLALTDVFAESPYTVELERDLSARQQFLDVIILEEHEGEMNAPVPDGLENLRKHNLLTYKSHQESLDSWTLDELLGHYVNYRKLTSPSAERLQAVDEFQLYAVSTRYPRNLERCAALRQVKAGVYDVMWGSQTVRLIVPGQTAAVENNALWHMFSAIPDGVRYGVEHYRWHIRDLSTLMTELYRHYHVEGMPMPYTVQDYYHDIAIETLHRLTPKEILNIVSPEELLKAVPPEERLQGLSPEEIARIRALLNAEAS